MKEIEEGKTKVKVPAVYQSAAYLPPLPSKTLRISITLPSTHHEPEIIIVNDVERVQYLVHVHETGLQSFGNLILTKVIARLNQ